MATFIADRDVERELRRRRRAWGADHHDEVWEGVYFMTPLPDDEHQDLVSGFVHIFWDVISDSGLGKVRPGVNLAGSATTDVPDVVVFPRDTAAENCDRYWRGAADFVVEIVTPGDRTRKKIPFYSRLGVRELLIVDRRPWHLELLRQREG